MVLTAKDLWYLHLYIYSPVSSLKWGTAFETVPRNHWHFSLSLMAMKGPRRRCALWHQAAVQPNLGGAYEARQLPSWSPATCHVAQWSWFQWRPSVGFPTLPASSLKTPRFFFLESRPLFQQATGRMTSDQLQELFLRSWTIERDAGSQKAHKSNRKQRESQQKRFSLRAAMHHVKYPAAEMHFLTARYFSQSFLKKDAPLASKQAISSLPAMSAFLTHPPTSLRACPSYSMSERVSFDLPPPPPDTTRVNGRLPHLVSLFHPEGVEVEEEMIWGHYHYHLYTDQCNHFAHHNESEQYCCYWCKNVSTSFQGAKNQ